MKKKTVLFIIWGIIVIIIISILTWIGFQLKSKVKYYEELEEKLVIEAQNYIEAQEVFLSEGDTLRIESEDLIEELGYDDDVCKGYVKVSFTNVYEYKAYIKCSKYKTVGYEK